jgi:UPF0755 protein
MEKKEMSKNTKAVVFGLKTVLKIAVYIVIILLILNVCKRAISFGFQVFHQEPMAAGGGVDITVEIPVEASAGEIGDILEENGLIEDGFVFILQEYLSIYHDKIEGGVYVLNTGQTPDEMMAVMS